MNFQTRSEMFMKESQTRRREPIKARTAAIYQSYLSNHILPAIGSRDLSEIDNGVLKSLVDGLAEKGLSASSITGITSVVKAVVASAVDPNTGDEIYPRTWNNDFIQLPIINPKEQSAPVVTSEDVEKALLASEGENKALYALLAGSGLRIAEALSLGVLDSGIGNFWDPAEAKVVIRETKTDAGAREVDLSTDLNGLLIDLLGSKTGRMFEGDYQQNRRRMASDGIDVGFHAFRRFRITQLRKAGTPEGLVKFWAGHSKNGDITDRYDKTSSDLVARREWAERVGLGFRLGAQ
jgi:integrase